MDREIKNLILVGCKFSEDPALDTLISWAKAEESADAKAKKIETDEKPDQSETSAEVFKVSRKPGRYSKRNVQRK